MLPFRPDETRAKGGIRRRPSETKSRASCPFVWQDVEALAAIAGPEAKSALRSALSSSSAGLRLRVGEALQSLGEAIDLESMVATELSNVTIVDGMVFALRLATMYPTATVRHASLTEAGRRPEVAEHRGPTETTLTKQNKPTPEPATSAATNAPARRTLADLCEHIMYYEPAKPFLPTEAAAPSLSAQHVHDDLLDLDDVLGKRIVQTGLHHTVTIREENAAAALEVMSRFAVNPKWLVYLPPTMSPSETTSRPGLLEHPAEAFAYYRDQGIPAVVCEEKHMGSRAVVVVCKDDAAARDRFGVSDEGVGIVVTRTGRRFFNDASLEAGLLDRLRGAIEAASLWSQLETRWLCIDAELMPWSFKAQELVRGQYAATGAAAGASLREAVGVLGAALDGGLELGPLLDRTRARASMVEAYRTAYRHYCWTVGSLADVKLAPFHLMASEGRVHVDKDHLWHMKTLAALCARDEALLVATPHRRVDMTDTGSIDEAVRWWEELTGRGGEGMVVKPLAFVARGSRGLLQPAIKCRGPEYLRIIYGPEYTAPENLERLRSRGLSAKRSLALREFALGIEGLERFVRKEPLRRVHECVFGVLALESEPVDPRL